MKRILILFMFLSLPLMAGNPLKSIKSLFHKSHKEEVPVVPLNVLHILALLEHKETHTMLASVHVKSVLGENNTYNTVTTDCAQLNAHYSVSATIRALNNLDKKVTFNYIVGEERNMSWFSHIIPKDMSFDDSFTSEPDEYSNKIFILDPQGPGSQMPIIVKIRTYATQEYLPANLLPQTNNSNNAD